MRLLRLLSLGWLACCGGGSANHVADSGGLDAPGSVDAIDAFHAPDAAIPGVVAVAVTVDGAPASGVQVYFQNADSTLVAGGSALTGAGGSASATMIAGGFVTVLQPIDPAGALPGGAFVDGTALDTFSGVEPGDVLHIDIGAAPGSDVTSVIDLVVPTDHATGVTTYKLFASCSNGERDITPGSGSGSGGVNPPVTVTLADCLGGRADIVIASADGSDDLIDYIFAPAVAVGSGSATAVAITGAYAKIPVLVDTVTDLEPGTEAVDVFLDVTTPSTPPLEAVYHVIAGDAALGSGAVGSAAVSLQMPTIPGGQAMTAITISNGSAVMDTQEIIAWAPSPAASVAVDYEHVQVEDITTTPVYEPSHNAITWSSGTIGAAPDFVYATMGVKRADGSAEWQWQIVGPGTEDGHVALPTLPTDVFDFNFADGDSDGIGEVECGTVPGGYDAVRGELLPNADFEVTPIITAPTAQIATATYFGAIEAPARGVRRPARPWRAAR